MSNTNEQAAQRRQPEQVTDQEAELNGSLKHLQFLVEKGLPVEQSDVDNLCYHAAETCEAIRRQRDAAALSASPAPVSGEGAAAIKERLLMEISDLRFEHEGGYAVDEHDIDRAVEDAFARLAALSAQTPAPAALAGWIPVSERLPEKMKEVLVYRSGGTQGVAYLGISQTDQKPYFWGGGAPHLPVTHWQPLPSAPTIEGKPA